MAMEEIKNSITCSICMEIATLPVHAMCCENSKSLPPACMTCVRGYLELNLPFNERSDIPKKSWTGCGCMIYPRQKASNLYSHTVQLDSVRNLFGPSICHHEECRLECSTSAELRRHLAGTSKPGDKSGNCQYAMTKCKHCNFFGVRHVVEGSHYDENHNIIHCSICMRTVLTSNSKEHYKMHLRELKCLERSMNEKNIFVDDEEDASGN